MNAPGGRVLYEVPKMWNRPRCPGCGRRLKPSLRWVDRNGADVFDTRKSNLTAVGARKVWLGTWSGYGEFCTQRCATDFANEVAALQHPHAREDRTARAYGVVVTNRKARDAARTHVAVLS